ncbi:hypothetical protein [Streptomyces sp. CFMR 7]|uniref:hypothetical protein n=1 Tax=Streptomyces sp. CFMR 7 TaxID=1649184 RepID=UPI0003607822|nr:hypothetical protein [Streptomyces sp. CFMR 7]MYR36412.1 hypothetical protein [Streptomyces sp. SID4944]
MTGSLWALYSLVGLGLAVGVLLAVGWAVDYLTTATPTPELKERPMVQWLIVLVLALVLAVALPRLTDRRRPRRPATPPARDTERRMWVACHRPRCGHMEWPHDVTAAGLRCTHCGHINTPS